MFLIKFFYFLKGYVIIEAYGKSVNKLISRCADSGIRIFRITCAGNVRFVILRKDFAELAKISRLTHTKIKISEKHGLAHVLHKYRKRHFFVVGAIAFALFFAVASRFLWSIEVVGGENIGREAVLERLSEIGVKPGTLICRLPSASDMKNCLVNSFDNVPWAWVYVKGVKAYVQIHEGTVAPVVVNENEPCDIIASHDGFVTDMSVKKGKKEVIPGNAVNAGELLVSGFVASADGTDGYFVHADGVVNALTHYEVSDVYSLKRERLSPTGEKKSVLKLCLFSKEFDIFSKPGYEHFILHSSSFEPKLLPFFKLIHTIYENADKTEEVLPRDWVVDFAKRDLAARISARLSSGAIIQREDYIVSDSTESVRVTAKLDFIENIGVCVPRQ